MTIDEIIHMAKEAGMPDWLCAPQPVGWIYEDDEGRMMFSQMPHPDPLWEPVYRMKAKNS